MGRGGGGDAKERVKRGRSDFLAECDHHGRRAIFYSLRHSHGTALAEAGVPQKDIQASLNHTRSSTTDRYVKSGLRAKAKAVNALPAVLADAIVLPAVGTNVAGTICLPNAWLTGGTPANAGEQKNPTPDSGVGFRCEGDGTRPRNHRIDRPWAGAENPGNNVGSNSAWPPAWPDGILATPPAIDAEVATLLSLLPRLSHKERRQLLVLAQSMVE